MEAGPVNDCLGFFNDEPNIAFSIGVRGMSIRGRSVRPYFAFFICKRYFMAAITSHFMDLFARGKVRVSFENVRGSLLSRRITLTFSRISVSYNKPNLRAVVSLRPFGGRQRDSQNMSTQGAASEDPPAWRVSLSSYQLCTTNI